MENFKKRLEKLMAERNFNNSSLGRKIGKVPTTVKNWVDGKGMPEMNVIEELAKALDTTPAYLLFGIKEEEITRVSEPMVNYGEVTIKKEELLEFYQ